MGKIVGRYWYILLSMLMAFDITLLFGASIELGITNIDGSPLVQVGVGHPFLLEATLHDVSTAGKLPQIEGIEQFNVKHVGMRMISTNGVGLLTHKYEVRIDKPGTHVVGPATIEYKGNTLSSDTIPVTVGKEELVKHVREKKQVPIVLRLSTDKEQAVVGERITCFLRCYVIDSKSSVRQFTEQEMPAFHRTPSRGPRKGMEAIEGVPCPYVEWEWDLYPTQPGAHLIPAYGADYDREVTRDDVWGDLDRVFTYIETKRVYSNAISLQIHTLPPTGKTVQGIGSFSAVHMSAKPSIAKQGEGIVLAIEVLGDGNPDSITMALQGIPKDLKYYESKQVPLDPSMDNHKGGKRFEFIIQGLKPGSWEIPSQSFYYYDVLERAYKELYSAPLTLTIMAGNTPPTSIWKTDKELQDDIADIHREVCDTYAPVAMSWWLFMLLFLLPLSIILYRIGHQWFTRRARINYRTYRAQRAFQYARGQLAQWAARKEPNRIYGVFMELFADRWQVAIGTLSAAIIEERLKDVGMPEQQRVQWNTFFEKIAEVAFGVLKDREHYEDFFNEAERWIQQLEMLL